MEKFAEPIRLEIKEGKDKTVLVEIAKWRKMLSILGAGALAIGAIHTGLERSHVDGEEKDSKDASEAYSASGGVSGEAKEIPFSYTLQDVDGLLVDLDKKILLGGVTDEQMDTLKTMIKQADEYEIYLQNLNLKPDGGTTESGYVDESKPTN
ncbi:MAG: hypothetical protein WCQ00_04050 [bacterium]